MILKNLQSNISLKNYNTFGIDANAKEFILAEDTKDLMSLYEANAFKNSHLIIGGGSNILLTNDFNGLVIKVNIKGKEIIEDNEDSVLIEVGAGENWHKLVLHAIENHWSGIENLSLIPGTMGAAPMQNIGAYGVEIKDVFEHLYALDKNTGKIRMFNKTDCQFDYRSSIFKTTEKGRFIILKVCLRLKKEATLNTKYGAVSETLKKMGISNPGIKDVSNAVIKIRTSKLPNPKEIGNAGSFFKNPIITLASFEKQKLKYPDIPSYPLNKKFVKVPAGWLIEKAGWKGKAYKNTGVHEKQALVLVNRNNASGIEVRELSQLIIKDIAAKFDIQLECEVNII